MSGKVNMREFYEFNTDRREYKAEPSDMPRWQKRVTRMYPNRHETKRGWVATLGWELRPENREYTRCVKVEVYTTTWRK